MSPIFSRYKPRAPSKSYAVRTAYAWHGGQSSPLYSFASCGGVVHTEEHKQGLRREVKKNLQWCADSAKEPYYAKEYGNEVHRLTRLLEFINNAPLKESLQ